MSNLTFLMSHMVYFNNMKRNVGHIKVTQKPPQPMDYTAFVTQVVEHSLELKIAQWYHHNQMLYREATSRSLANKNKQYWWSQTVSLRVDDTGVLPPEVEVLLLDVLPPEVEVLLLTVLPPEVEALLLDVFPVADGSTNLWVFNTPRAGWKRDRHPSQYDILGQSTHVFTANLVGSSHREHGTSLGLGSCCGVLLEIQQMA